MIFTLLTPSSVGYTPGKATSTNECHSVAAVFTWCWLLTTLLGRGFLLGLGPPARALRAQKQPLLARDSPHSPQPGWWNVPSASLGSSGIEGLTWHSQCSCESTLCMIFIFLTMYLQGSVFCPPPLWLKDVHGKLSLDTPEAYSWSFVSILHRM